MSKELNSYNLSRAWFDFCFENPEMIKPNHTAIYFFAIENCNRLGWKKKFALPTTMAKEAIGIKSYNTYINALNDLIDWGFIEMIQKSTNQFSANIIALSENVKALDKALDKALIKHGSKQRESTGESIGSVNKQGTKNKEQLNKEQYTFDLFWNLYNRKVGKPKCLKKWENLLGAEKSLIMDHVPKYVASTPDVAYRKHPMTYLNQQGWMDEIIISVAAENSGIPQRPDERFLEGKSHEFIKKVWAVWRSNGWEYLGATKGWVEKRIEVPGAEKIGNIN